MSRSQAKHTKPNEFKRLEYPRPNFLTRSSNLEGGANPSPMSLVSEKNYASRLISTISLEHYFAKEEKVRLADWLNLYEFKSEDFGGAKSRPDPILVAGIIILGLNNGFSYTFLSTHISKLCSMRSLYSLDGEMPLPDPTELLRCQAAVMFARPCLEFKDRIKSQIFEMIRNTPACCDSLSESACFSALLSFLCKEKISVSVDFISKIREGRESEVRTALDAGLSRLVKRPARLKIQELSFSKDLLVDRDNDSAYLKGKGAAQQIDAFTAKFIMENKQYAPYLLPSEKDKSLAVEHFLSKPQELTRLYESSYNKLKDGFKNKTPQGFHDHDQRHILFAVPATGLMLAQTADSYTQIFGLLCCLLHDAGRIVEPGFIYTDPRRKELAKVHPQISAAVCNNILDEFPDLPASVRNEIIVTVAMHDSGAVTNSPLSVFAQSVDRLQLIGPEYITRALGYLLALQDKPFYAAETEEHPLFYGKSLIGSSSFYLHKLFPNYAGDTDIEFRLSIASGTFLSLAAIHLNDYKAFFESEILPKAHWPNIPDDLKRAIERSTFKWRNGHCMEWPHVQRSFGRDKSALEYVEKMCSMPLVSKFDFKVKGVTVRDNLRKQIEIACALNPQLNLAFEYISKVALSYHRELEWIVKTSAKCKSPAIRTFAEAMQGFTGLGG